MSFEVVKTELRWIALVYDQQGALLRLSFYNDSKKVALKTVREFLDADSVERKKPSILARKLTKYAAGNHVDFSGIPLSPLKTLFQENVRKACMAVGYGETATYGELAENVGSPRAARAVGLCMRNNPIPIVVPCHRIIGSTGRLIGFSAGPGLSLKEQMLKMESVNR